MNKTEKLEQLASWGIYPFPVGQVMNPLRDKLQCDPRPRFSQVSTRQSARLEPMVLDYGLLVDIPKPQVCLAGAVAFGVEIPTIAHVRLKGKPGEIHIEEQVTRPSIVRHAALIMQSALGVLDGLTIDVEAPHRFVHAGLGSSASLQVAVASAINYLYGQPITPAALPGYLAQNYGEEIEGDPDQLIPVQSIGDTAAVGFMGGGMVVVAGEATVIARMHLPEHKSFIIGIPHWYRPQDSLTVFSSDSRVFDRMLQAGRESRYEVAYQVLHLMLPAMVNGDLRAIGEVMWQARCSEQNLNHYDTRYPGLKRTALRLRELMKAQKVDVLSISSAGPIIFAYTSYVNEVTQEFYRNSMEVAVAKPNNTGIAYTTS